MQNFGEKCACQKYQISKKRSIKGERLQITKYYRDYSSQKYDERSWFKKRKNVPLKRIVNICMFQKRKTTLKRMKSKRESLIYSVS